MVGKKATLMLDFKAFGHPSITALNKHKLTITKRDAAFDDSVIAVRSDLAAADLPAKMKEALSERKKISLTLRTAGNEERIDAFGSFRMDPTDAEKLVFMKSDFTEPDTVGVRSNKTAADLHRDLVALLQDDGQEVLFEIRVMES